MKIVLKKVICLIVAICICFSVLPTMIGVMADDAEWSVAPAVSLTASASATLQEGMWLNGAWEDSTKMEYKKTLNPVVNLSTCDYIEFDVYIENYENFMQYETGTGTWVPVFVISSKGGSNKAYRYKLQKYVTKSGWNHVVIPVSEFDSKAGDGGPDLSAINTIMLAFRPDVNKIHVGERYAIANVYGTSEAHNTPPKVTLTGVAPVTLHENMWLSGAWEDSTKMEYKKTLEPVVDLSTCDYIEFDVYIENYENFMKYETGTGTWVPVFVISSNGGNNKAYRYKLQKYVTKSGWNHVVIPVSEFDSKAGDGGPNFSAIDTIMLAFRPDVNKIHVGERYAIANVYGTYDADTYVPVIPSLPENIDKIVSQEGYTGTYGNNISLSYNGGATYLNAIESPVDMSKSDYVEFDVYVGNIDVFKQYTEQVDLYFSFTTTTEGNDLGQRHADYQLDDLVTKSGWNHIKLARTDYVSRGQSGKTMKADQTYRFALHTWTTGAVTCDLGTDTIIVANICGTLKPDDTLPSLPENIDKIVSQEGYTGTYGNNINLSYNGGATYLNAIESPVDMSKSDYVEFDVYVGDIDVFKQYTEQVDLYFSFTTTTEGNNLGQRHADYQLDDLITKSGWNHIKLARTDYVSRGQSGKTMKADQTYRFALHTWTTGAVTCDLGTDTIIVANICGTLKPDDTIPPLPENIDKIVSQEGYTGTYGNNISLSYNGGATYVNAIESPVDMTNSDYVEFDVYVGNIDVFKQYTEQVDLYFSFTTTTEGNNLGQRHADYQLDDLVTKSGWNHIKLARTDYVSRGQSGKTMKADQTYRFVLHTWTSGAVTCNLGTDTIKVANICGTSIKLPELPENVLAQIGTSDSGTLGEQFHYVGDRIFEEKLEPVDFSKGTAIEFDIYVEDYEALLATEEASANNNSGSHYPRNSKLALYFSSTPASLWSQYSAPRNYFCEYITLSDKITHSGWNHVVIGKGDFTKGTQTLDWANLTGWMIKFENSSNVHPEPNPNPNLMIMVGNIVNTGVVADIPKDSDKESKWDKTAVYISNADTISDDNGTWNPGTAYISNDYKNEGKGSVALDLNYKSVAEDANVYYLLDESADMSDIKTLKFDFFIDLPQFIQAQGNKAEIVIANNRNATDNYYKWNLDFSSLKSGWNSFDLDFNSAVKTGNPNLSEAKIIMLRFTELSIDATVFAEIVIGIDNLRYLSSTGSTTLKINSDSEDLSDNNFDNDIVLDTDFEINDDSLNEDTTNNEPIIITSEPITKYTKTIKNLVHKDYKTTGIILGIEAAVLTAAVTIFMIVYSKKKRKHI